MPRHWRSRLPFAPRAFSARRPEPSAVLWTGSSAITPVLCDGPWRSRRLCYGVSFSPYGVLDRKPLTLYCFMLETAPFSWRMLIPGASWGVMAGSPKAQVTTKRSNFCIATCPATQCCLTNSMLCSSKLPSAIATALIRFVAAARSNSIFLRMA